MLRLHATAALLVAFSAGPAVGQIVATFENNSFPVGQPVLSSTTQYENGLNLPSQGTRPGPAGSTEKLSTFASNGAVFGNAYNLDFGSWSGWSYSRVLDNTTPGFENQYAAFNPSGVAGANGADSSANYGVSFGTSSVALPAGTRPDSVRIANTTYAVQSMLNGDDFAKKFGGASGNDPDFFLLTVTGKDAQNAETGTVSFYLADYRFANNAQDYIVSQWATVDLTTLGAGTTQLSFDLTSSDLGPFGMNTPAYFAADNFAFTPVPEPTGLMLLAGGGVGGWRAVRRRGKSRSLELGDGGRQSGPHE